MPLNNGTKMIKKTHNIIIKTKSLAFIRLNDRGY